MRKIPKIIPISRLRQTQNEVLAELSEGPVVLTQHGEPVAVLADPEQWNRLIEELETWQDSYQAMEVRYELAVGEDEVIDFVPARAEA